MRVYLLGLIKPFSGTVPCSDRKKQGPVFRKDKKVVSSGGNPVLFFQFWLQPQDSYILSCSPRRLSRLLLRPNGWRMRQCLGWQPGPGWAHSQGKKVMDRALKTSAGFQIQAVYFWRFLHMNEVSKENFDQSRWENSRTSRCGVSSPLQSIPGTCPLPLP